LFNGSSSGATDLLYSTVEGNLRNLLKESVSRNPDKNGKAIKDNFLKELKKELVGKVAKSSKYILAISRVDTRRLNKEMKFSIWAQPLWLLVDESQQV